MKKEAQIIAIGDELLIGQVLDTNSNFIAKKLHENGITTRNTISCSDNHDEIKQRIVKAWKSCDIVITTGGLGPTRDDKTKDVLCDIFNCQLVENEKALQQIERLFKEYIKRPMNELNKKQALLPSIATPLENPIGTAPGLWLEKSNKVVIALPGVPMEMKKLIREQVIPKLKNTYTLDETYTKKLTVLGVPESELALRISSWEDRIEEAGFAMAYLPAKGSVRLRISKSGDKALSISKEFEKNFMPELQELMGESLISSHNERLEAVLGEFLRLKNQTISTVESCTGGRIGTLINAIPGASSYYRGTLVSYATALKINPLGVSPATIDKHTVVSEAVASEMANRGRALLSSDICVATTGVAGPAKGEDGRDVGTICFAIANEKETFSSTLYYPDLEREEWMEYVSKVVCNNVFKFVKKHHG